MLVRRRKSNGAHASELAKQRKAISAVAQDHERRAAERSCCDVAATRVSEAAETPSSASSKVFEPLSGAAGSSYMSSSSHVFALRSRRSAERQSRHARYQHPFQN